MMAVAAEPQYIGVTVHGAPTIRTVDSWPSEADDLVASGLREDFHALLRLRDGWRDGSNRFSAPGEALFAALQGSTLVGVGGLNRDPFTTSEDVGRLRHLYVAPAYRRCGVATALVTTILEHAKAHFRTVRLRTDRPDAHALYLALGFHPIPHIPDSTHTIDLASWRPCHGAHGAHGPGAAAASSVTAAGARSVVVPK